MNQNESFNSPLRSQGSFGDFARPKGKFSPMCTSSPRDFQSASPDFIPFGNNSPGSGFRSRGRWRGQNRSLISGSSSSSFNSSYSPGMGPHSVRSSPYNQHTPHRRGRGHKGNMRGHQNFNNRNISDFYHHSMVEDPWADLEEKLQNSDSDCSSRVVSKNPEPEVVGASCDSDTESSGDNELSQDIIQDGTS